MANVAETVLFGLSDFIRKLTQSPQNLYDYRTTCRRTKMQRMIAPSRFLHTVTISTENDGALESFVTDKVICTSDTRATIEDIHQKGTASDISLTLKISPSGETFVVPLLPFVAAVSSKFEAMVLSDALCFIADASSGLSARLLVPAVRAVGVQVVPGRKWLLQMSDLLSREILSEEDGVSVVRALCRLEGWSVREAARRSASRTVAFVLPGMGCTAELLPVLWRAFPCERHVFAYDGCVPSVGYRSGGSPKPTTGDGVGDGNDGDGNDGEDPCYGAARVTFPISSAFKRMLATKLGRLPLSRADATEGWISSVDAFLKLKEDNKKWNEYLPFVLRCGFLLGRTGLGDGDSDKSERCLANVLQFVTGSRTRPIAKDLMHAALEALEATKKDLCWDHFGEPTRLAIEDCVFAHRAILLGNKTLIDTVQPKAEWSLKATRKVGGCSCCAPEDEEEEEEEEENNDLKKEKNDSDANGDSWKEQRDAKKYGATGTVRSSEGAGLPTGGSYATKSKRKAVRSTYVDGSTAFAFDPSKFK